VLNDLGVGRLVVTGAQTDACIRSTLHGAFVRGYDALLVSDAHTTDDHTEWELPHPTKSCTHELVLDLPRRAGPDSRTATTEEVSFESALDELRNDD